MGARAFSFEACPRSELGGVPEGERGPRGLRVPRADLYASTVAFSFAAALKVVVFAGGECLTGESAENTVGIACCLLVWVTPRAIAIA